ncbi:hypothetical protein T07_3698 [Trichinella nelsoni]|uniref:Uncharacterized protein n=1 Tax=Trichinella nelsoni TaxID=6336 RepID=A0A0V0RIH0_9BILA|nr:hypothetical protein T07_3698 [Trichinella nelsoni]
MEFAVKISIEEKASSETTFIFIEPHLHLERFLRKNLLHSNPPRPLPFLTNSTTTSAHFSTIHLHTRPILLLFLLEDYCSVFFMINYLLFYGIGIFSLKKEILQICDISQSKSDLSKS